MTGLGIDYLSYTMKLGPSFKKNLTTNIRRNSVLKDRSHDTDFVYDIDRETDRREDRHRHQGARQAN